MMKTKTLKTAKTTKELIITKCKTKKNNISPHNVG